MRSGLRLMAVAFVDGRAVAWLVLNPPGVYVLQKGERAPQSFRIYEATNVNR